MRILLFTGKGGVGKTTVAAATALRCARLGYRTLVISTDPAHSLADALDVPLGPEPVAIEPNLYGQELDVYYSMKKHWGNMRQLMLTVFRWQGVKDVVAEEMSALPGMEEASAFLWIEQYYREDAFDVVIIDSAPTGETLTLLTLPQVTKWWVTKAFPLQKLAIKGVGAALRKTTGVPLDKGYEELENLFGKLEAIQGIFADPGVTSMRLVVNPERMVIKEAKRAYTYLQLYGYNVDAVVVNRVLPPMEQPGIFARYLESQAGYLEEIEESFAPLPVLQVEHAGREVFGLELLESIGESLYGETDPTLVFHEENPVEYEEVSTGYTVRMKLPFLQDQEFGLSKFGDELVLELGNRRKHVFLPRFAHFMTLGDYRYHAPWLEVSLLKEQG
jgi:arsenite-transporting ATPase